MQQTMQQQVLRNPELLRNVMESPLVQSLVSNPEVMRSIMQSNPQMRELMEASFPTLVLFRIWIFGRPCN